MAAGAGGAVRRAGGRRLRDRPPAADRPRGRSPKPRRFPTSGSTGWAPASPASRSPRSDGQKGYNSGVGDSVYYGDCVQRKGIFGGGSCLLPLQVTTVIYGLHSNATLGPQRNTGDPRGPRRPCTTKGARSSSTAGAWRSTSSPTPSPTRTRRRWNCARSTRPARPAGSCRRPSTAPACRARSTRSCSRVMASLPGHACQRAAAAEAEAKRLSSTS